MVTISSLDTKKCYLDLSLGGKPLGRVVIELLNDAAPLAAENFFKLCTAEAGYNKEGVKLSFKNNYFHRVIKNFIIQAGDIVHCTGVEELPPSEEALNIIGTGGASVYLDNPSDVNDEIQLYNKFQDENLSESTFESTFNVAMSNNDKDSNTSQFFINTYPSPHLNGKHTIFGKVVHGKSVIREIEKTDVINSETFFPKLAVKIDDCGEFTEGMEVPCYNACYDQIGGDIYEEFPDDDDHFDKDEYHTSYKVCETIKNSGNQLFKKKDFSNALFKFKKALRYVEELQPEKDVLITKANTDAQNQQNYAMYINFLHLKKNIYSNLSLTNLKLEDYTGAIKYSQFMIDMLEVYPKWEPRFEAENSDFLKCYYRIGKCYMLMSRLEKAKMFLIKANEVNTSQDKLVIKDLEIVEKTLEQRKETQKKSLAKFFGS